MSKLRYAAISVVGTGGVVTNALEPMRPSSSADQKATIRLRLRGCFDSASAMASTAAVPEALSSAP